LVCLLKIFFANRIGKTSTLFLGIENTIILFGCFLLELSTEHIVFEDLDQQINTEIIDIK